MPRHPAPLPFGALWEPLRHHFDLGKDLYGVKDFPVHAADPSRSPATEASLGGTEPGIGARGHISVNAIASSNRSMYVLTSAKSAINADRAFTLLIRC
jgi:hypothetical protein